MLVDEIKTTKQTKKHTWSFSKLYIYNKRFTDPQPTNITCLIRGLEKAK